MTTVTMLQTGKIKILPHYTETDKQRIESMTAKDYIMSWFVKRTSVRAGISPSIKISSLNDKILILKAGTGSGKSATLGPELYKNFFNISKKDIAVTQPRILTTMEIPTDITKIHPYMTMGKNIGYQTGDFSYKPVKGGVVFMTTGVLVQQLKTMTDDEFIQKYSFIIIDECHDRSLDMDLLLYLTKSFMKKNYKRPECPFLILTSATFDTEKYANYFNVDVKNIIEVEGLNYPIEHVFPSVDVTNYVEGAINTALSIHVKETDDYKDNNKFTDILIFVYGNAPLVEIASALNKHNKKLKDNHFVVIELNRNIFTKGDVMYRNIFKPLTSINVVLDKKIVIPKRRIIVSTNIAETGVTIDTAKYLIDTGYENVSIFNPTFSASSLIPKPETRASALQRRGRVGRRGPGKWYPMFTEKSFNAMDQNKYPDIITSDMTKTMLGIMVKMCYPKWDGILSEAKASEPFDLDSLNLLDYPSTETISYLLEKMFVLGLIDAHMIPTTIGLAVNLVAKVSIESIRMILAGYQYGANILDLITIASFMEFSKRDYTNTKSKISYNYASIFKKDENELKFYNRFFISDDFIETLFIWGDLIEQIKLMKKELSINHIKKWCKLNGLVYKGILSVISMRDSLIETFIQTLGLDPYYNGLGIGKDIYSLKKILQTNFSLGMTEIKKIKSCIYEGYRLNVATWNEQRSAYYFDYIHQKVKISSKLIKPLPVHDTIKQIRPKKIIVKERRLEENVFSKVYEFKADTISSMDGFVDIDETYIVS